MERMLLISAGFRSQSEMFLNCRICLVFCDACNFVLVLALGKECMVMFDVLRKLHELILVWHLQSCLLSYHTIVVS